MLDQELKCAFYPGPPGGFEIDSVGGQRLGVSGDKIMFMTEVKTTWGTFHSEQEFLILDQDGEGLVMGVIWYNSVMTDKRSQITEIVDMKSWNTGACTYRVQPRYRPGRRFIGKFGFGCLPQSSIGTMGIMHF